MYEAEVRIKIAGPVVGLIHMRIKSASTEVRTKEILLNIHMYNIYAAGNSANVVAVAMASAGTVSHLSCIRRTQVESH
jgi:hypothetical protein